MHPGASGGRTQLFRSFYGVTRKPRLNRSLIYTEPKPVVKLGRKLAYDEQREGRSY